MMKILKSSSLLLFTLVLFNSCASVFLSKTQTVTIKTGSADAIVYLDNEKMGKGKSVTDVVDKGIVHDVVIVYGDEYLPKKDVLYPSTKKVPAYYVCQVFNAPFIAVYYGMAAMYADYMLPKSHAYPEINNFNSNPKLKPKRNDDTKFIYLSNIAIDIKDIDEKFAWQTAEIKTDMKQAIADAEENYKFEQEQAKDMSLNKHKSKKVKKELLDDTKNDLKFDDLIFTTDLQKILHDCGYMDTINNVFIDNNNTLILEGKIKNIDFFKIAPNVTKSDFIYFARTDLNWYIKNAYSEIIDSIPTITLSERFARNEEIHAKLVGSSISQSFYSLFENGSFQAQGKIENDLNPHLDVTKLNKPTSVVKDKRDASEASVIIKTTNGHGSGFAITNDGYILTNYHVIIDTKKGVREDSVIVIDNLGNEYKGTIEKFNKFRDVALIKVNKEFSKAFYCTDEKSYRIMDDVFTIGAPKSISLGQSISIGLISNERNVNNNFLIQLNMSVNSGNSGGPIFDDKGTLHGVVVSKLVGNNTEGVSFAIPGYKIKEYLNLQY